MNDQCAGQGYAHVNIEGNPLSGSLTPAQTFFIMGGDLFKKVATVPRRRTSGSQSSPQ